MLSMETFHSIQSLYEVCMDAASGRVREGIAPFVRRLNEDAALTFSRQGPCLLTLPSDAQARVLMFLAWLCSKGLIADGLTDLAALTTRLTESVREADVSIPPLCSAIIATLSSHPSVKKAQRSPAGSAPQQPRCGQGAASQKNMEAITPVRLDSGAALCMDANATDSAPGLQAASDWADSGCKHAMPAEVGSALSQAFYANSERVVQVFRSCSDATILNLARMPSSAAHGLLCEWPILLHRCLLLPRLLSPSCSGSAIFAAALAAAAEADTHTTVHELLTPVLQQPSISAAQERVVAPLMQVLDTGEAVHLLQTLCKDVSTVQAAGKCALASQLVQVLAASSGRNDGGMAAEGSMSGAMGVVRALSACLKQGIPACSPPPQPGVHLNAVCDLIQQVAMLACAQWGAGAHGGSIGEAQAVLRELLGEAQTLKGMRGNALVKRLQALQSNMACSS
eukprot:jgi/Ulvmu1/9423/UM051_0051.1